MAVRLFVGNLSYATTEADLRTYFGTVAPPSQVVLPVDRETGRPRGFAFVEFIDRAHAEQAIQRFNGQAFNGRPLAVSEARAREDRGPGGPPRPGGPPGAAPRRLRPPALVLVRSPAPFDPTGAPAAPRGAATSAPTPSLSAAAAPREEEGRRAPARADSAQGHRPLVHARRRFAGRRSCRTSTISPRASPPHHLALPGIDRPGA